MGQGSGLVGLGGYQTRIIGFGGYRGTSLNIKSHPNRATIEP